MGKRREYPVSDYIANIRAYFERATADQRAEGIAWYPTAHDIALTIADRTGLSARTVAGVISALSPQNPWHRNIVDAATYCEAAVAGASMPKACTFGGNQRKGWTIATTNSPAILRGQKVESFIANIADGDYNRVTVDVWATRAATNGAQDQPGAAYRAIELAYQAVAAEVGLAPAEVQAIVWVVIRSMAVRKSRKAA